MALREIIFRGKKESTGEWVFGDLRHYRSGKVGIHSDVLRCTLLVDPETVGQFTGLKDDNGTLVYEGDIIERRSSRRNYRDAVVAEEWNCGCCSDVYGFATYKGVVRLGDNFVVIGNIHDNPELMKEGGEE